MELLWLAGIVVGIIALGIVLAVALRGMRPKLPEAQTFTPVPVMRSTTTSTTNVTPPGISPQVIAEIDRLVAAGHRRAAIKVLRRHGKLGLREAKDKIAHWSISTTAPSAPAVSRITPRQHL